MWKKHLKFWIFLSFSLFVAGRLYFHITDGFNVWNISSTLSYDPRWDSLPVTKEKNKEVLCILNQNYKYLGKGCQSYVFESDDGKYVMKFFKFQHLRTTPFWKDIPMTNLLNERKEKTLKRRQVRLDRLFTGCKVAFEQIPEETGVVFIHLNKTDWLKKSVTIIDKIGLHYSIDLDEYAYIVQKRACSAADVLKELSMDFDARKAQFIFRQMLDMIVQRTQKGVLDLDPATIQNIGFSQEGPMILDVGQLVESGKEPNSELIDLVARSENIRRWIRERYPNLEESFEEELENLKAGVVSNTLAQ